MLDYALGKEEQKVEISEKDQNLVIERFAKVRANPERLLDWKVAKETLDL